MVEGLVQEKAIRSSSALCRSYFQQRENKRKIIASLQKIAALHHGQIRIDSTAGGFEI